MTILNFLVCLDMMIIKLIYKNINLEFINYILYHMAGLKDISYTVEKIETHLTEA